MPSKRNKIYLSGPMSGDPGLNFPAVKKEAERLRSFGYEVINQAELNPESASWQYCMRVDLKALLDCDTLALLPGWEGSSGAHLELHVAHMVGIEIVMSKYLT